MEQKPLTDQQQLRILQDIIRRNHSELKTDQANHLNFDSNFQTENLNESANNSKSQSLNPASHKTRKGNRTEVATANNAKKKPSQGFIMRL